MFGAHFILIYSGQTGGPVTLAASIQGQAAFVAAFNRAIALGDNGGIVGTSVVVDTMKRAIPLLDGGGILGTSTMTDAVKRAVALKDNGGLIGTSAMVDAVNRTVPLKDNGGFVGTSTLVETLKRAIPLLDNGGIVGTSAVVDAMRRAVGLLDGGGILGTSTMTDAVKVARKLVEALVAKAVLSDNFNATRPLADTFAGSAFLVDPLSVARHFTMPTIEGVGSTSTPNLLVHRAMIDVIVGAAALGTISMKVARTLIEAIDATATFHAPSNVARAFVVATAGQATLLATEKVKRAFISTIGGAAAISDALKVARALSLAVVGTVVVTADFTTGGLNALAVSILGSADEVFNESVSRALGTISIHGTSSEVHAAVVARLFGAVLQPHAVIAEQVKVARKLGLPVSGSVVFSVPLARLRPLAAAIDASANGVFAWTRIRSMFCSVLAEAGVSASPLEVDRALSWIVRARAVQSQQIAIAGTLGFSIEGSSVSASALALFSPPAFLNAADFLAVVLASLNRGDIVSLTASDVSEDVLTTEESSEDAELSATDSQVVQLTSTDRNIE